MTEKSANITKRWIDPDDAPEWTDEDFATGEIRRGGVVVRPEVRRGRPPVESPKAHVSLRLDQEVLERFKAGGKGWQSRINEVLKKSLTEA